MTAPTPGHDDCGRTLEQLSDYLQTGASDDQDHIEHCPQCQAGLAALRRLDTLTKALIEDDVKRANPADEPWFRSILDNLRLETRSGRTLPLTANNPNDALSETEGSVIALIRAAGDAVSGSTIGRCRINGDLTVPGAPVRVDLNVTAVWGTSLYGLADELRKAVADALAAHTELNVTAINITVTDLATEQP
ncbi:Asp23/Gls24 family envelope stress response protein [Pseudarthrobacter oxydans]|jgi:hypothetical protein|uniref:Asp23/Gls24 family envelope stress response protein n=1 Tax=Pseudarthrobacter oxydans TaxID=1671 RepID=UPI00381626A6